MQLFSKFAGFFAFIFLFSCGTGPKEINPTNTDNSSDEYSTNVFSDGAGTTETSNTNDEEIHSVKVLEVMPTQRYSYLRVDENGREYWIATLKDDFKEGEIYHYNGGLLKRNFKSVEHNRVFEELYLVSNIVSSNHALETESETIEWSEGDLEMENVDVDGSMKISEIVAQAAELNGKTVQVSGKVTKVNPNIMGTNWVHLNDGSNNGFDMVLTTNDNIPVGHVVTFNATVATNKDFGAGYSYELILEKGELIN